MFKQVLLVVSAGLLVAAFAISIKCLADWSLQMDAIPVEPVDLEPKRPPHILFIFADDYGYADIEYNGRDYGSAALTPTLDRMAREGVTLKNYYVQNACTPSRSQLLSGRYQIHTGLQHDLIFGAQPNGLPLDEVTLPELLRRTGYTTRMLGKWHIGFYNEQSLPTNRGFDDFLGYVNGQEDYYLHNTSFVMYDFDLTGYDFLHNTEPQFQYAGQYSTHLFTEKASEAIMNHNQSQPMFMYLAYQAPHSPVEVPEHYTVPFMNITDAERRTYLGDVLCMDEGVKNVTEALKASGMYNDTIIIFSADNGGATCNGASNWPLRGNKSTLWEGGIRGIGFVHSPLLNESVKGTINRELIHVSDWLPTLVAGIAGGSLNGTQPLDGFNVWDTIKNGAPSPRKEILFNIDPYLIAPSLIGEMAPAPSTGWSRELDIRLANLPHFANYNTRIEGALRVGDWKIHTGMGEWGAWVPPPETGLAEVPSMKYPNQTVWLFNITADPLEKHDLSEQYPDVVEKLLDRLNEYYHDSVPVYYPPPELEADPVFRGGNWLPWQ